MALVNLILDELIIVGITTALYLIGVPDVGIKIVQRFVNGALKEDQLVANAPEFARSNPKIVWLRRLVTIGLFMAIKEQGGRSFWLSILRDDLTVLPILVLTRQDPTTQQRIARGGGLGTALFHWLRTGDTSVAVWILTCALLPDQVRIS